MKRLFITLFAVFATLFAFAQDVIFSGESDSIVAKVISVGTSEITYQKWTNLQGPIYSLPINQITAIRYENGTFDYFNNKTEPVIQNTNTVPSLIRSGNTYMYGDLMMNKGAYAKWLNEQNCPSAYQQFNSGWNLSKGGWFMMGIGLGLDLVSIALSATNKSGQVNTTIVVIGVIGAAFEIACIPTIAVGYSKMHRSVDVYNTSCSKTASVQPYWAVQASSNGLGLAYHF